VPGSIRSAPNTPLSVASVMARSGSVSETVRGATTPRPAVRRSSGRRPRTEDTAAAPIAWWGYGPPDRIFGDPVLKSRASDVTEIDGKLVRPGRRDGAGDVRRPRLGLAAPQVGVQKRFFVYDLDDGTGRTPS
jgi:hypothetical protein